MNRLTRSLALVLASTWSTLLCAQAAPEPMRAETIHLYNGEVKILPVHGVRRVAVGNGKLLSVTNLPRQLIMIGTGVGDTNLLLWNGRGEVRAYNIDVSAEDTQQTAANLRATLRGIPGLRIDSRGGEVVLSGDVTPADAKLVAMVAQNIKGGVINLTHASNVDMKRMIYLDVQVVDFKKSVLKNLGINWQNTMSGPALGVVGSAVNNPYFHIGDLTQGGQISNQLVGPGGTLTGLPNQMPFSRYFGITTSLSSVINLSVQNGDAYILANPQLSTRSGGDATFLAGGEVPIPVSSALGQTTVTYKNYGVQLNIKPVADRFGNIEASVDTEVSQIDPSVTVDGYPGFLTRKTSSVVNVHSGQTIVMSGLVQATGSDTLTKFPWLGNVPILGALFRDTNFQADRDEMVIFVTPVVFNPGSRVNHEAIGRGVQIARKFNDSDMGRPVWMPGFGVGPASHLPNSNPPKPVHGKVMPVAQPAAPAGQAAPVVPTPAQTQPLQSAPVPALAASTGAAMSATVASPTLPVTGRPAVPLHAPGMSALRLHDAMAPRVALVPTLPAPVPMASPLPPMSLPHVPLQLTQSQPAAPHRLSLRLAMAQVRSAPAPMPTRAASLRLPGATARPLNLLALVSTAYLPVQDAATR
jgi:pilus assembly protein CpaC